MMALLVLWSRKLTFAWNSPKGPKTRSQEIGKVRLIIWVHLYYLDHFDEFGMLGHFYGLLSIPKNPGVRFFYYPGISGSRRSLIKLLLLMMLLMMMFRLCSLDVRLSLRWAVAAGELVQDQICMMLLMLIMFRCWCWWCLLDVRLSLRWAGAGPNLHDAADADNVSMLMLMMFR